MEEKNRVTITGTVRRVVERRKGKGDDARLRFDLDAGFEISVFAFGKWAVKFLELRLKKGMPVEVTGKLIQLRYPGGWTFGIFAQKIRVLEASHD